MKRSKPSQILNNTHIIALSTIFVYSFISDLSAVEAKWNTQTTPINSVLPEKPKPPVKLDFSHQPEPKRPSIDLDAWLIHLREAKTHDEAAEIASKIERAWLHSNSVTLDLLLSRSIAASLKNDHATSLDLLDMIISLQPRFAEAWHRRAMVYFEIKDYNLAIRNIEMALKLQPKHYGAMITFSTILQDLNQDTSALSLLKQARNLYPLSKHIQSSIYDLEKRILGTEL